MLHCSHHPDRPAAVILDWTEDTVELCSACIVPELAGLEETLRDRFLGASVIMIRRVNVETGTPHPPADGDDITACAGCGHPVSGLDDVAAVEGTDGPMTLVVWHVNCPTPAGLFVDQDGAPHWLSMTGD